MCDPVTIAISLATSAASSYMQNKAAQEVEQQRAQTIAQHNQMLDRFRDKSAERFQKSLASTEKGAIEEDLGEAVEDRTADYQPAFGSADLLPGQGDASDAVKTAVVQSNTRGKSQADESARARANLDAYGDATLNRDITMKRMGDNIAQQGNFALGQTQNVLPLQLEDANRAGDKYQMIGDIIGALGTVGSAAYGNWAGSTAGRAAAIKSTAYPGMSFSKGVPGAFGPPTLPEYNLMNYMNQFGVR